MKTLIRWMILFYRKFLNPILHVMGGPLAGCRFQPSCSQYFLEAVEIHGVCRGVCLGVWRILRCNPWGSSGYDPVPPKKGSVSQEEASIMEDESVAGGGEANSCSSVAGKE